MITHIYDFLEKSVLKFPEKLAFVDTFGSNFKSISYKEFNVLSKKLASKIAKDLQYSYIQSPILILLPKSIDCLISFFGVSLSGNFYTLLDEKTPKERVEKVINILKPKLLITSKDLNFDLNLPTLYTEDFLNFDIDETLLEEIKERHIDTNLLYVFFTSGSTGVPKGVSISHKSVIDYTFHICHILKINNQSILLNQTPFYFSASVRDIFSSIKAGATLHLLPNHLFAFPNKILSYLEEKQVSIISWVPTVLSFFAKDSILNKFNLNSLRTVAFVGELIPIKTLHIWKKHLKNAKLFNLYGPTEIAGTCCYYEINRNFKESEILPIGNNSKNTELLVFDENMNFISPKEIGIKGELYIRGTCLSLGYYNDSKKTKEAFIQNPLHNNYLDLLYKTGDIVAYNELGELLCFGRKDNQIKYMGHRIELGEIESVINSHLEIKNAACIFKEEIICFYESEKELNLKAFLKDKLNAYMIPKRFIRLDSFKLNQNGKIDRIYLKNNLRKENERN